jgi:nucleotide-binding universal stress UspA family protein
MIVGRQGLTGLGRRLLGGVTERILHRSDVPVLVISGEDNEGEMEADYSRVLITTDGSGNAEVAIPHGTAIAQRYGSDVHILNLVDLQAAGGAFNAGGLEKEFLERLDARGQDAVDSVANTIEESALDLTIETAVERTAAGVREYVEKNEIDVVIMGSHGRSNLKRELLGSVAFTVLRTVDIPVLVVKRSDCRPNRESYFVVPK